MTPFGHGLELGLGFHRVQFGLGLELGLGLGFVFGLGLWAEFIEFWLIGSS